MTVKGKTLLVLGGYPLMVKVIEKAHELGVRVVCTDWNEDAPARGIADSFHTVSTTDVDALIELCRSEGVDGIFPGAVDVNLVPAAKACQRLGFPCYATDEQFALTLDKLSFKQEALASGLPVARSWNADEIDGREEPLLPYPLIVKPADSYSSRGISVCRSAASLRACIDKAKDVSPSDTCIVEEFLEGDDVYLYFTVQNGRASLSAMADRITTSQDGDGAGLAPQPQFYSFPSKYLELFESQAAEGVQRLVDRLTLLQGTFMLQGIVSQGSLHFFEMGLRMTGGAGFILIRHVNEIDQCEMHIRYALGEPFGPWDVRTFDYAAFGSPSCVLVPLVNPGRIERVEGMDAVSSLPSFVDSVIYLRDGDKVSRAGTLDQALARIYFSADSVDALLRDVAEAKRQIRVLSAGGEDMLLPWFSDEEARRCLA